MLSKVFDFKPGTLIAEAAEEAAIAFGYGHGSYTFGVKAGGNIDQLDGRVKLEDVVQADTDVWIVFTGSTVGA